jgi:hypothetical protein
MSMVFVFDWAISNLDVHVYLYSPTYILVSSGIFVCLYNQILDVINFHVWMSMYTCLLRGSGIYVCLYNQAMRSLIFILRDARMLVFPEVVECMYTSIAESLDIHV